MGILVQYLNIYNDNNSYNGIVFNCNVLILYCGEEQLLLEVPGDVIGIGDLRDGNGWAVH